MLEKGQHIVVRVSEVLGHCPLHVVGEEFEFADRTPPGLCAQAFVELYPLLTTIALGGTLPEQGCPDPERFACGGCDAQSNRAVFRIIRVSGENVRATD